MSVSFANIEKSYSRFSPSKAINPHPIYFVAGDVNPRSWISVYLPKEQLEPGILYDLSCDITDRNLSKNQPIVYAMLASDNDHYSNPQVIFNGVVGRPRNGQFQAQLSTKANQIVFHNFACLTNSHEDHTCNAGNQIGIYNFDDSDTITFENCYISISEGN